MGEAADYVPVLLKIGYRWFARWWTRPMLSLQGTWSTRSSEPLNKDSSKQRLLTERVKLKQWGSVVWGTIETNEEKRRFEVHGEIHLNLFIAKFHPEKSRKMATRGKGTLLLEVSPTGERMDGYSIWYDADTKSPQCSKYVWERADPLD